MQTTIGRSPAEGCVLVVSQHMTEIEARQYLDAVVRQLQDARTALEIKKRIDAVLAEVAKSEENPAALRAPI